MRTAINVAVILIVGLAIGLGMRSFQKPLPTTTKPAVAIVPVDAEPIVAEPADAESATQTSSAKTAADGEWLTSFKLTERSGEQVSSEELKGQPYVASFFFSTCPSICVMQNQKIQQLQTEFKDQGVRFVAISVDPETDTPEQLREYSKRFKADEDQWLFLTGDLTYIRRIGAEVYQVAADKKFHIEKLILVDASGKVMDYYSWADDRQFEQLKTDIAKMIASEKEAT